MADSEPENSASLDNALDSIIESFEKTYRLENSQEKLKAALNERLINHGFEGSKIRLMEVNLFGSLSGWMEFILEERMKGNNVVPDFARHLRRAFFTHCRQHGVQPEIAIQMAVELATEILGLASSFRKHMSMDEE